MPKVFKGILLSLLLLPLPARGECLPLPSEPALTALLQQYDSLYFFASWCPLCATGLAKQDPKRVLFVPFRDLAAAATTCLAKFQPQGTCLLDPEGTLARRLLVEEVPATRSLKEKPDIPKEAKK